MIERRGLAWVIIARVLLIAPSLIAAQPSQTVPQVAINWLLQRPSVSTVLIGARDEAQLRDNLGAVGWSLDAGQVARLDAASATPVPYPYYPYWNGQFAERTPAPVVNQDVTTELVRVPQR